jgi:hypothetical protein
MKCSYLDLKRIAVVVRGVYDEAGETADRFDYKYAYCEKN